VILSGFNHDQKTPKIQRYHPAIVGRSNRGFDWNGEGAVMKTIIRRVGSGCNKQWIVRKPVPGDMRGTCYERIFSSYQSARQYAAKGAVA
jgi:hypothetical protein